MTLFIPALLFALLAACCPTSSQTQAKAASDAKAEGGVEEAPGHESIPERSHLKTKVSSTSPDPEGDPPLTLEDVKRLEINASNPSFLPDILLFSRAQKESTDHFVQRDVRFSSWSGLAAATARTCWRVLRYFEDHVTHMNLDAVMGTRIAEGQFHAVLKSLEAQRLPTLRQYSGARWTVINTLRLLHSAAVRLSDAGQYFIRNSNPEQYSELGALLSKGFWEMRQQVPHASPTAPIRHLPSLVLAGKEQLNENKSDECLAEVSRWRGDGRECTVSKECWGLMTSRGYSGYSLTHQVFYFIIGLQAGCGRQLDRLVSETGEEGGVSDLILRLCSAVLGEAHEISEADFPEYRRDLFMEQGALCGLEGYTGFFREPWVARVLSWQREAGCYGDAVQYLENHRCPAPAPHTRVRREERVMAKNCLAHRSAVALGYLSVYTRLVAAALL